MLETAIPLASERVIARYWGRYNKARQDRSVFGDRHSGAYLHKFKWTNIVRHRIVMGRASPDDPALADYWAQRRRKTPLPIEKTSRSLHRAQDGRCPICKAALLPDNDRPQTPHQWEQWLASARKGIAKVVTHEGPKPDEHEPRLAHARCRDTSRPALLPAYQPEGLARAGCSETGTPGSEGGRTPQGVRPTRPKQEPRRHPSRRRTPAAR